MPGGRPPGITKLGTIVLVRDDPQTGRPVKITASQRIIEVLRIGEYVETAAAIAGVDKTTIYEWLRIGAAATDLVHRQGKRPADLTPHQRRCMSFSHAVDEAQALARTDDVAALAELGQGGRQIVTTTTKRNAAGEVLEHTTRTETAQPNAAVLMWRLERRHPGGKDTPGWGRKPLEISGPDGEAIPVEVRAQSIVAALKEHQRQPIEATATEVMDDDEGDDADD